jgi:hypothetical protein
MDLSGSVIIVKSQPSVYLKPYPYEMERIMRITKITVLMLIFLVCIVATLVIILFAYSHDTEPIEVSVKLEISAIDGNYVCYTFRNRNDITELVTMPLKASIADPRPAKYVIIGSIEMLFQDNHSKSIELFSPIGRFKNEEQCRIADFKKLFERMASLTSIASKRINNELK